MKIRPVGAESFLVDERTDRHDEANSCLSQHYKVLIIIIIDTRIHVTGTLGYATTNDATTNECYNE
jgi:hypothetical protein